LKAAFTVLKWSVGVQGIMREAEGVGNSLASAAAVLNQGKPGSKVYVSATVKFPTGLSKVITAEYSL
jgi:hypothetical protein